MPNADKAARLKEQVLPGLPFVPATSKPVDKQGARFHADIPVVDPAGSSVVRARWGIDSDGLTA